MLSLTRKTDYALRAMAELARQLPGRMSARKVAKEVSVPLPVLTNILYQLSRTGLVTSTMGSRGGYTLARRPEEITFADIIEAIEGPFKLTRCSYTENYVDERECDHAPTCRIRQPVKDIRDGVRRVLSSVSLAELASEGAWDGLNP